MKRTRMVSLLIAGVTGLLLCLLWLAGAFDGLENKALDYHFLLRGTMRPPSSIVIVDIDEASIAKLGRWPWSRSVHARLVDRLARAGAKAVMFDVLFTEAEKEHPGADRAFAQAIRRSGRVVLNCFFDEANNTLHYPLPRLAAHAPVGFADMPPDPDGVVRRARLFREYNGAALPSFDMAALPLFLGQPYRDILAARARLMDAEHRMMVNYYGPNQTFPYFSYADALEGRVPDELFRDNIVLVGATAAALFDAKVTPFTSTLPGVEVHANILADILARTYLVPKEYFVFLFIVAFVLFTGLVASGLSPLKGGAATAAVFLGYSLFSYLLFSLGRTYIGWVVPVLTLLASYFGILFYRFMTEEREKRWIKKTFSHYLSAHVMESILADPGRLRLGGQRENLTVLFSDIRGFTGISEALKPEEVVELLNEYLSKMVEVVFRHDGTLDKFIGDAVMAFWGAPVAQSDHPKKAVLCAVEMIEELTALQNKWRAEGKKIIEIGIGINTGDMIVGNMGSKEKMEYTVIGDNVNLGSRLEGLNKEFRTHIIISDTTYQAVKDVVEARPLGTVKVKGKEKPVDIYEVTGKKK